jgi:hypothetical protein
MNDDHDDLDRALFALPLEEPPAGLRASILHSTVFASQAAQAPLGRLETTVIGVVLALATWLAILLVTDRALAGSLETLLAASFAALTETQTVFWLGLGAAVAAWLSLAGSLPLRGPFFGGRTS